MKGRRIQAILAIVLPLGSAAIVAFIFAGDFRDHIQETQENTYRNDLQDLAASYQLRETLQKQIRDGGHDNDHEAGMANVKITIKRLETDTENYRQSKERR